MSTQQDIYAAGSESRHPMLNKENYVPWSSHLFRYAKSRPNGKLIYNSILNGPYVKKTIPEPGDVNRDVNQMMKGSDIRIQEKKAKLFNEWERFTSNEGELIESYYHRFLKLMNDLKRNKHFPEKIASNLKFLNNLQIAQPGMNMGQDRQMQMIGDNGENQFRQYAGQNAGNPAGYNDVIGNQIGNGNLVAARAERNAVRPRRRDAAYLQTQLLIAQKEEAGIQLQAEEYDLMAAAADLDDIEVNANCILMDNLQQASTSGTQTDSAPVYDTDGSAEISELNKQLSKEKSTVSFLLEEKKRLKSDFKTCEDELLDKQILLEKRIKELNNIVLKTGQLIQTIHMLLPKLNSFYHTEQKMALGYQNSFYLKQAQKKQQSLYDGKVLLEKHEPPVVHDSEETLQLAQESRDKMKQMNKEIKPANYTKINHLSGVFVPQKALSPKFVRDFKSLAKEADTS
nr:hypothetical protein [Tanacetum cinerariifolium]